MSDILQKKKYGEKRLYLEKIRGKNVVPRKNAGQKVLSKIVTYIFTRFYTQKYVHDITHATKINAVGEGLRIYWLSVCKGVRPPHTHQKKKEGFQGRKLNYTWLWDFISGALGRMKYFIVIIPCSIQTRSVSACWGLIYGLKGTVWKLLILDRNIWHNNCVNKLLV